MLPLLQQSSRRQRGGGLIKEGDRRTRCLSWLAAGTLRGLSKLTFSKQGFTSAAISLTAFTAVAKVLSLAQQVLIGRAFGVGAETDALVVAQIVPLLVGGMLGAALTTTLIPLQTDAEGWQPGELTGSVCIPLALAAFASATAWLGSGRIVHVLGPGLSDAAFLEALQLLRTMAVLILLLTASGALTAFYYARSHFIVPAAAASLLYLGGIGGTLLLRAALGPASLAAGLVVGGATQLVVLLLFAKRVWFARPVFAIRRMGRVMASLARIFAGASISTFYLVLDRSFATRSGTGLAASYAFAGNLITLPGQLVVANATSALLPFLVLARGRPKDFRAVLGNSVEWVGFVLLPIALIMLTWAGPMVRLLFRSAAFGLEAVRLTASIVLAYGIAIFGLATKDMATTGLIALGREEPPVLVGLAGLLLSWVLKLLLVARLGYLAIAYSTDVAVIANGTILWLLLLRSISPDTKVRQPISSGRLAIPGSSIIAFWFFWKTVTAGDRWWGTWLYPPAALGVYVAACAGFRVPGLLALVRQARSRLGLCGSSRK